MAVATVRYMIRSLILTLDNWGCFLLRHMSRIAGIIASRYIVASLVRVLRGTQRCLFIRVRSGNVGIVDIGGVADNLRRRRSSSSGILDRLEFMLDLFDLVHEVLSIGGVHLQGN